MEIPQIMPASNTAFALSFPSPDIKTKKPYFRYALLMQRLGAQQTTSKKKNLSLYLSQG
jgi:hypothetical protein